jgi:hypothetical protein
MELLTFSQKLKLVEVALHECAAGWPLLVYELNEQ